jgi:predicted Zn-dependent protease
MDFRISTSVLFGLILAAGISASSRDNEPAPTGMSVDQSVALSARWDLGYYLFQSQDYNGAAAEFEKLRKVMPKDATLLALIGSCYSMSGRWSEGERALQEALAQNHEDADLNGLLGQFYLSAHQPMKGAFYLEHALRLSPEQEDLRTRLVEVYMQANQFEKSRVHLETLLKDRGGEFGDPELDHAFARCLVRAGKFKDALKYAMGAQQSDPANPAYARTLGLTLMGLNRFGEAARLLSASRPWLDGSDDIYMQLGEALFQDRQWDEAEAAWLEGTRKFPDSYALLSRLLEYYIVSARPAKASRVLAFARMQNPGHPGNLLLEARLGRKLGSYSLARMAVDRLKRMACGPLADEALWEEAQLDFETGRTASCGKILDKLLGEGARSAEAHLLKAKLALQSGDLAAAQTNVLEARKANPYDMKVYALARQAFSATQDKGKLDDLLRDAQSLLAGSGAYALNAVTSAP